MKAAILAGRRGIRPAEETRSRPKPIVRVGHLGCVIEAWFANHTPRTSDVMFGPRIGETQVHAVRVEGGAWGGLTASGLAGTSSPVVVLVEDVCAPEMLRGEAA